MATLTPLFEEQRLAVDGDISASLLIPANPPREVDGEIESDAYFIAFSDGTLVMAYYEEQPAFHVMVEGAGRVSIDAGAWTVSLDWDVEWINLAWHRNATAFAPRMPAELPLLKLLDQAA